MQQHRQQKPVSSTAWYTWTPDRLLILYLRERARTSTDADDNSFKKEETPKVCSPYILLHHRDRLATHTASTSTKSELPSRSPLVGAPAVSSTSGATGQHLTVHDTREPRVLLRRQRVHTIDYYFVGSDQSCYLNEDKQQG